MKEEERRKLYSKVLEKWGVDNQLWMVCEECGELLNAIAKINRNRVSKDDVITELADVTIMCEQIAQWLGYNDYKAELDAKLTRLQHRLLTHKSVKKDE